MVGRSCLLASLLALLTCSSALAQARFAGPAGTSTNPCTREAPCDFATAVQGAANGDEVVVLPGTYSLGPDSVTDETAIFLHGDLSGPRPQLKSSVVGAPALQVDNAGTTVRWLGLSAPGGSGLQLRSGFAEELVASAGGLTNGACEVDNATLRDSVCVASSAGAPAILSSNGTASVRNVTAEATGSSGIGIHATAAAAGSEQLELVNVIAHGAAHDISADAPLGSSCSVTVTHSNYVTAAASSPATISDDGTQQTAAPVFSDAQYDESAASPTVARGLTNSSNGQFDYAGNARVVNGTTDIGADQLDQPPTVSTEPATMVHPLGATLWSIVNPGGLLTRLKFQYGTTVHYGSSVPAQQIGPVGFEVPVSMAVLGLAPGTRYHFRAIASSALGIRYGKGVVFVTPPLMLTNVAETMTVWRAETGTFFTFTLNDTAGVVLSFTRLGRRHRVIGTKRARGQQGQNTIAFHGRVNGKQLKPGRYVVTISARVGGASSTPRRLAFSIVS